MLLVAAMLNNTALRICSQVGGQIRNYKRCNRVSSALGWTGLLQTWEVEVEVLKDKWELG